MHRRNNGTRKAFYIIHCGIIDILQSYGIKKQMEALGKSLVLDGPAVSVSPPPFYGRRFRVYMTERVFKPSEDVGTEVICHTTVRTACSPRTHASSDKCPNKCPINTCVVLGRCKWI